MLSRSLAAAVALASVAHGSYNAVTSIGHEVCIPYTVQVTYTVTVDTAGAQIGSSKSEPVPKDKPAEAVNAYTSGKNGHGSGGYDGSYGADSAPAASAVGQNSHGYGGLGYNGGSAAVASKADQGSHGYGGGEWNGDEDAEPGSKPWGYGGKDGAPITSIAKGYGAYSKAAAPTASGRKPYGSYEDEGDKDDYEYEDDECDDEEDDDDLDQPYSAKSYSGKGYSAGWSSSKSWSNAYGASSTSKRTSASSSVSSSKSGSRSASWTSSSKISSSASSVSQSSVSKSSNSLSSSMVSSSLSKSSSSSDASSSKPSSSAASSSSSVSSSFSSGLDSSSSSSAASSSSIASSSEIASSTISSFTSSDVVSSTSSAFSSTSSAAVCVLDNANGCLTDANCCNVGSSSTCVQGQCLPCVVTPDNYIANAGFDSGSLSPWEETPFPGVDSGVLSDVTAPDNDEFVYRADYGPGEYARVSISQVDVPIPSGTTVNCDFFYKIFDTETASGATDSNNAINLFIDNVLCSGSSPGTRLDYTQTGTFDYVVSGNLHVVTLDILQIVGPPAGSRYRLAVDTLRIRPVRAPNGAAICPRN